MLTEVEQFTVTFPLLRVSIGVYCMVLHVLCFYLKLVCFYVRRNDFYDVTQYSNLQETKIGKVMKAACAQNYPDDEFNLKERASQLMKNWKALLPTTEPESSKEGENGAHKSVAGDQVALENSEHPQDNQAKTELVSMETTADHSLNEHNGQSKKDDAMPMDVDLHVKEDGLAAVEDAGPVPMEHDGQVTAKHELAPSAPTGEALTESGNNAEATEYHAMLE